MPLQGHLVNAKPSPKAHAFHAYQSAWYRLVLLGTAVYLAVLWFVLGPSSPGYGISMVAGTFALGPALAAPLMHRLPRKWFRVPAGERTLHRILGVGVFEWLLDVTGWNRFVAKPMRGFMGRRADLYALEQSVRANASAHGACFVIHVILAVLALLAPNPWSGAFWMLAPGVVLHLYPVLLQRSIMLRLQPLLDRIGSR